LHGIICENSGKRASQTQKAVSKQKHKRAKQFGDTGSLISSYLLRPHVVNNPTTEKK